GDDHCISGAPTFVDAENLNFHQVKGSPTIDAGYNGGADKSGGDLAGLPRVLHKTVDIGAYEFPPPPSASDVKIIKRTHHALKLTATVLTQKLPAVVRSVARHGKTSVKGTKKTFSGSVKAKVVSLVVKHLQR